MKYMLMFLLLVLTSCGGNEDRTEDIPPALPTASQIEQENEQATLEKLKKEAAAETDKLKKAEKQLAILRLERDIAERLVITTTVQMGAKEGEIRKLKLDAIQTKLYIGAGALFVIAVILGALAFYFKSAHMAYGAIGTVGVSGLVAFAGVLTPWALEIGITAGILFIIFLLYLLFGRDKALFQLTKAVNTVKAEVPNFKQRFGYFIDEAQDDIIDATRERWGDPAVKK
jgi:hypothetical protein